MDFRFNITANQNLFLPTNQSRNDNRFIPSDNSIEVEVSFINNLPLSDINQKIEDLVRQPSPLPCHYKIKEFEIEEGGVGGLKA